MTALQCDLWDAATVVRNRVRNAKEIARQMAQCDRLLAEDRARETPPLRRCSLCDGLEVVASPHVHHSTKRAV
jgi:hypothetical protein